MKCCCNCRGALPVQPLTTKRSLGLLKMACIGYMTVAAGPYGIEDAVIAGGPGLVLLFLAFLPFLWAFPQSFMTAEMANMFSDHNGGYVEWVYEGMDDPHGLPSDEPALASTSSTPSPPQSNSSPSGSPLMPVPPSASPLLKSSGGNAAAVPPLAAGGGRYGYPLSSPRTATVPLDSSTRSSEEEEGSAVDHSDNPPSLQGSQAPSGCCAALNAWMHRGCLCSSRPGFLGFRHWSVICSYNGNISGIFDLGLYLAYFESYLGAFLTTTFGIDLSSWGINFVAKFSALMLLTLLNTAGLSEVAWVTVLLGVLVTVPL